MFSVIGINSAKQGGADPLGSGTVREIIALIRTAESRYRWFQIKYASGRVRYYPATLKKA